MWCHCGRRLQFGGADGQMECTHGIHAPSHEAVASAAGVYNPDTGHGDRRTVGHGACSFCAERACGAAQPAGVRHTRCELVEMRCIAFHRARIVDARRSPALRCGCCGHLRGGSWHSYNGVCVWTVGTRVRGSWYTGFM
eukprot:1088683-Prymnesium_polylepis.3